VKEVQNMNFREYLNFLFGNAFRTPFIKSTAAIMVTLSLGVVAVGMWRKARGGGKSGPQQRKAA
jgi:hypothetical protein